MMRLDVLDSPAAIESANQEVFQAGYTARHAAFFLAVSMVVDLYRFRHDGPVVARRSEALTLLREQIEHSYSEGRYRFSEDDDLARRSLMFAHKSEVLAIVGEGKQPSLSMEGFFEEEDLSADTLNSHLSPLRRRYLFDGIRKVVDFFDT